MFRSFSTEMRCALFVGCVFILFFAISAVSIARAGGLQWDSGSGSSLSAGPALQQGHPSEALNPREAVKAMPPNYGPPVSDGPLDPFEPCGGGVIFDAPAWWLGWCDSISDFFDSILASMGF
jgi:hypothetical protein